MTLNAEEDVFQDSIETNNNLIKDACVKKNQLKKESVCQKKIIKKEKEFSNIEKSVLNNKYKKENQSMNENFDKLENKFEKVVKKLLLESENQNDLENQDNKKKIKNGQIEDDIPIHLREEFHNNLKWQNVEDLLKKHEFEKKFEHELHADNTCLDENGNNLDKKVTDIEEFEKLLEDGRGLMIMFVDNKFEEVLALLEERQNKSMIYQLGAAALYFFDAMLSMDKEKLAKATSAMKFAAESADRQRKKTSYLNYFFTPDYNTFSDIECHAELNYAIAQLITAILIALEDQTVYGFVNGGIKIRMAYSSFRECLYILNHKTNWQSKITKMHFESGTRLGIGAFDLIISFFPSKLAKLLEYIGFNSDRDYAIKELTQAVNLTDALHYDISSILLCAYYGFLEYFYGLGQSSTLHFEKSEPIWLSRTPNSSFIKLGFGVREMMEGRPDQAITYFNQCIKSQSFWLQLHFACNWEICWAYVMKSDWKNAAECAKVLKDNCKWSPAMFTYLYAVFHFMELENENKLEDEFLNAISEEFKRIPKLKRKLGGKKAFHEKIVLYRSKKFHDNVKNLLLAPLELIYIWNFFYMMAKNSKLFEPFLENIEKKLIIHTKIYDQNTSLDQYCYLTFMKAVIYRHLEKEKESIKLFEEILSCKKRIKEEVHLLPQSCFELGMIYKSKSKTSESKKWFKKARDEYSDYLTESMIQYRVDWALSLIRKEKIEAKKQ